MKSIFAALIGVVAAVAGILVARSGNDISTPVIVSGIAGSTNAVSSIFGCDNELDTFDNILDTINKSYNKISQNLLFSSKSRRELSLY